MKNRILKLHSSDNVVVAIEALNMGEIVEFDSTQYPVEENIPRGHKLALIDIPSGNDVIKYGFSIGKAVMDIKKGERIHTHNLKTGLRDILNYSYEPQEEDSRLPLWDNTTIEAYKRDNGEIGIRNELWIIPLVGCINGLSDRIADIFQKQYDTSHLDGVFVWKHPFGCSQLGDDLENTQKFLASLATHPNAGGVLLLGLGCENNTLESFLPFLGGFKDSSRMKYFAAQSVEDEIEESLKVLTELADQMKKDKRETCSFFDLKIGLKCGGSDAFSGITGNPLLGSFADSFTKQGGCVLMSEVPEMFGAETILMNRAKSPEIFRDIVSLINDFKEYYNKNEQPIYENPSPGNKDGGISTLEDKSLGCTQKGGHVPVSGVLGYAQKAPVSAKDLWLIQGPGNDQVAVSNLGVAGAHIVLFSTGRGTPFGGFIPTIKVSTNTELTMRKKNWIDFDAGQVLERGDFSVLTKEFGEYIRSVASGTQTNNEKFNSREISIFKKGVVL